MRLAVAVYCQSRPVMAQSDCIISSFGTNEVTEYRIGIIDELIPYCKTFLRRSYSTNVSKSTFANNNYSLLYCMPPMHFPCNQNFVFHVSSSTPMSAASVLLFSCWHVVSTSLWHCVVILIRAPIAINNCLSVCPGGSAVSSVGVQLYHWAKYIPLSSFLFLRKMRSAASFRCTSASPTAVVCALRRSTFSCRMSVGWSSRYSSQCYDTGRL